MAHLTMPKGKKATMQAQTDAAGVSVNAYNNAAIDEKMERDQEGANEELRR